ncbi:hypothetical protein ACWKT3_17500 [Streptomyces violaceus]
MRRLGRAAGPELNVSFSFLVASGDVPGVRLATVDRTSNADGLDTRAYCYDGVAKKYGPSPRASSRTAPGTLSSRP